LCKIKENTQKCLDDKKVNKIYEKGDKELKNFACRLFNAYFNVVEKRSNYKRFSRLGLSQMFDPVRLGYIKRHLTKYNGNILSNNEWAKCKVKMRLVAYRAHYSAKTQANKRQTLID
jgi:hypothetical protein